MHIVRSAKKTLAIGLAAGIILLTAFAGLEPAYLRAQSASDTMQVTLTVDAGITISTASDATMSPNLGVSTNQSLASTTWNVKTNDPDGYTLTVQASTSPAMRTSGGITIADYTPATPGTPDTWSVPSGTTEFGYSAYGNHVSTGTWGTGSLCGSGAGVPSATQKWNGFATTTFTVATSNATTTTSGTDTTVCFAAEQDGVYAAAGTYTAYVTATATVQ